MLFSSIGVKILFVTLYIISNIWGAITIINQNRLIADHAGWPTPTAGQVYPALMLIITSYLFILFIGKEKSENKQKLTLKLYNKKLSVIIFFIQVIFFVFILIFSAAKAGDTEKSGGVLRFLFYIINSDMLFLIYYAATMYSKDKISYRSANLMLFFVSNLTRGWIGQILFIVFISAISWIESSDRKLTKIKMFFLTIFSSLLFIVFSLLMYIKVAMREGFDAILSLVENLNYIDVFSAFFDTLFSRIQLISTVLFQISHKDELTKFIKNGTVGNFYTDGLPQQTIYNIVGIFPGENLNLFLWKNYIPGYFFDSQTTVQPGLIGWFYILPYYWIVPFIAYILFLVFLNFKLIKIIGGNGLRHLSWFAILIFLIPSWIGAYISFIWSIWVFMGIIFIAQRNLSKTQNIIEFNDGSFS